MPQPKDKDWLKGYKSKTPMSTRDPPQNHNINRLKVKSWEKIFHADRDQRKTAVAILSVTIDFEIKAKKRDKQGH